MSPTWKFVYVYDSSLRIQESSELLASRIILSISPAEQSYLLMVNLSNADIECKFPLAYGGLCKQESHQDIWSPVLPEPSAVSKRNSLLEIVLPSTLPQLEQQWTSSSQTTSRLPLDSTVYSRYMQRKKVRT